MIFSHADLVAMRICDQQEGSSAFARLAGSATISGSSFQVEWLIDILALFHQRVLAHDAKIGAAVFHVGRINSPAQSYNVSAPLEDQFAGIGEEFAAVDADLAEQLDRFFQDTPLRDRNGNPVSHSLTLWISAPRAANFFSIDS